MSEARKVLLIEEPGAAAAETRALATALQAEGAQVKTLPLAPPYDALLDALAEGWLPVLMGSAESARDIHA